MRYLSVCSGIEAATAAWHQLGWTPEAYSEIEPFPAAVLAHHYPEVSNLGDMTNYKEWDIENIDLLVGGTPCQSFSVAGLRKGLDDPRGNLALVYLGIAERFRPRWILWENVPGVLSSNRGRDFGSFLGALAQLGYGFAYRVLDAQYFGVPQRRRRVFVVGHLGDWRRAAAVLFERRSMQGHSPPSRKAGKIVAALTANGVGTCGADDNQGQGGHLIPYANAGYFGAVKEVAVADSLRAKGGDTGNGGETLVCGTLQANEKAAGSATQQDAESGLLVVHGTQDPCVSDIAFAQGRNNGGENVVCQYGDIAGTLAARHDSSPCADRGQNIVAFGVSDSPGLGHCLHSGASKADKPDSTTYIASPMQVRRLMPVECERLQGFPDNYTQITGWNGWRDVDESTETPEQLIALGLVLKKTKKGVWRVNDPDGPRYKALGNSMAVPVIRWIGERIQLVDDV